MTTLRTAECTESNSACYAWLYDPEAGKEFTTLGTAVRRALSDVGIGLLAAKVMLLNDDLIARGVPLWPGFARYMGATDVSKLTPTEKELSSSAQRVEWAQQMNLAGDPPAPIGPVLAAQRDDMEFRLRRGDRVFLWAYFHNKTPPRYQLICARSDAVADAGHVIWEEVKPRPDMSEFCPQDVITSPNVLMADLVAEKENRCTWVQFWNMPTEITWKKGEDFLASSTHEIQMPILVLDRTSIKSMVAAGCTIMKFIAKKPNLEQHEIMARAGISLSDARSMVKKA